MATTFTPPLAALTTVFTPPCSITWLLTASKIPSQYPAFPTTAPSSCDPPSWAKYVSQRGFEYYSPAICPSGFQVGPQCMITNPRTAQGFPAIRDGETAAYCVPSGHTCTSDTSDFRGGVWGATRTGNAQATVGPAIQIRWRQEDLAELETDPLTPGPPRTSLPNPVPGINTETESSSTSSVTSSTSTTTRSLLSSTQKSSTSTTTLSTESPQTRSSVLRTGPLSHGFGNGNAMIPSSTSSPVVTSSTQDNQANTPLPSTSTDTAPIPSPVSQPDPSPGSDNSTSAPNKNGDSRNGDGSPSTRFTVAATVLTTILITIIVSYATYATLRRYRRFLAGKTQTFFLFEMRDHAVRVMKLDKLSSLFTGKKKTGGYGDEKLKCSCADACEAHNRGWGRGRRRYPNADAELGTEGPLPELPSQQALGTKENPAELGQTERWSWMSKVSNMLTARSK